MTMEQLLRNILVHPWPAPDGVGDGDDDDDVWPSCDGDLPDDRGGGVDDVLTGSEEGSERGAALVPRL